MTIPALLDGKRVEESPARGPGPAWPFETITPEQFWALPAKQRSLIDKTVAALVASLPDS
jgi:hypothetical protein